MQTVVTTSSQTFNQYLKAVEKVIKQSSNYPTEDQIWQKLRHGHNRGQRRPTERAYLKNALRHLEFENKIMYSKGHVIIWVAADAAQKKILKEKFTPI